MPEHWKTADEIIASQGALRTVRMRIVPDPPIPAVSAYWVEIDSGGGLRMSLDGLHYSDVFVAGASDDGAVVSLPVHPPLSWHWIRGRGAALHHFPFLWRELGWEIERPTGHLVRIDSVVGM